MNLALYYTTCAAIFSLCICYNWVTKFRVARWNYIVTKLRIDNTIVAETKETNSLLNCYSYCTSLEIPYIRSLYYIPATGYCYCNTQNDSNYQSISDNSDIVVNYGLPNFYLKEEKHMAVVETKTTVWPYIRDCLGLFENGFIKDGLFSITGWEGKPIYVKCDMANEGWTVIQRRFDGSLNFYRKWDEYRLGFGESYGEHWIGLENIHYLTQLNSSMSLYGEVFSGFEPQNSTSYYKYFRVLNNTLKFRVEASDDLYPGKYYISNQFNGRPFSTVDNENAPTYCAWGYKSGWWFGNCGYINLHGKYFTKDEYAKPGSKYYGIHWYACWRFDTSLKSTLMKVRRVS